MPAKALATRGGNSAVKCLHHRAFVASLVSAAIIRWVTITLPTPNRTPITFIGAPNAPVSLYPKAHSKTHKNEVNPLDGSPRLKQNPCPSARCRAYCANIQLSSKGKPHSPATAFSKNSSKATPQRNSAQGRILRKNTPLPSCPVTMSSRPAQPFKHTVLREPAAQKSFGM